MRSLAGSTVFSLSHPNALEFCKIKRIGEVFRLVLSPCSNLNLSDHAMTGRHTTKSVATIMRIIVIDPHNMPWESPVLAAVCKYDPSPGRRKSRSPSTNISQAIRKNQPPATETIEFHTRPIAAYGSSSCQNRCHAE